MGEGLFLRVFRTRGTDRFIDTNQTGHVLGGAVMDSQDRVWLIPKYIETNTASVNSNGLEIG